MILMKVLRKQIYYLKSLSQEDFKRNATGTFSLMSDGE